MKIKMLFICFLLSLLPCMANASSLHTRVISTNQIKPAQQDTPKTEIFIDNNSNETVWISVNGNMELLISGFILHLYNNDKEINEVRIKMSKTPISEVFFNSLVPNHSRLKVKDYLPKPDSNS